MPRAAHEAGLPQLDLTDPVTHRPYEHERRSEDTYRTRSCADDGYHGAGRHCFDRKAEHRH